MDRHWTLGGGTDKAAPGKSPRLGEYQSGQVAAFIKRYQELRSAVELAAARHERTGGGGSGGGKEELLCTLIDVDQAIDRLSPRQKTVLKLMKAGQSCEQIGTRLGVGTVTVKFHAQKGIARLTTYLNLS
ncbi:MAG: LuxR C-terminal-related transcriptional regulator [Negativicutes bacterium]|nr:LuxR C-terminal-related transcriptional regulator [Negativicutes bacterium]